MILYRLSSCTASTYCDFIWVPAKVMNIFLDPFKGQLLIVKSQIRILSIVPKTKWPYSNYFFQKLYLTSEFKVFALIRVEVKFTSHYTDGADLSHGSGIKFYPSFSPIKKYPEVFTTNHPLSSRHTLEISLDNCLKTRQTRCLA